MNWTDAATATMTETLMRCRSEGATPEATAKAIDAAYPFGERARWPYKAWLAARKVFFAQHGLPRKGDLKASQQRLDDLVARMAEKKHWSGPQIGADKTAILHQKIRSAQIAAGEDAVIADVRSMGLRV